MINNGIFNVANIANGIFGVSEVRYGPYLVWQKNHTYTYELKDIYVVYSSGDVLLPNQTNYAEIKGTYITYKDGREKTRETVVCSPILVSSTMYTTTTTDKIWWNKDTYGKKTVLAGNAQYKASFGQCISDNSLSVAYAENKSTITSSTFDYFRVGNNMGSVTISRLAAVFPLSAQSERVYTWTSGEYDKTVTANVYRKTINVVSSLAGTQHQGPNYEAYYTFVNNSDTDVEITAILTSYAEWDEDGHHETEEDTDTQTLIVAAGTSANTRNLATYPRVPSTATGVTDNVEMTFYIKDDATYDIGESVNKYINYGLDEFQFTKDSSWLTIDGCTLRVEANSSGLSRFGNVTVTDRKTGETSIFTVYQR